MDRVQLCSNLSLRCELQSTLGIMLLPVPERTRLWFLLRASFFYSLCARSWMIFCHTTLELPVPSKNQKGILRTMTQLPYDVKLALDPFTGRLMWVQWSKDCHLSSGVLLYGDSNNSFWLFSSWLHFWTRAWTCVLGGGHVEMSRVARHTTWWMRETKSQFCQNIFSECVNLRAGYLEV